MLENQTSRYTYADLRGKSYGFPAPCFGPDDLTVKVYDPATGQETILSRRDGDYTVKPGGLQPNPDWYNGATVIIAESVDLSAYSLLCVERTVPLTQGVDLPEYGALPIKPLEAQLDRLVMMCQQLQRQLDDIVSTNKGE